MYDELRRAKEIGFDFVDELIDNIEILNLSGDEFSEFIRLANDERYLHSGELQGTVLCKNRNGVLLTNDRRAKNFCKRTDIAHFDIKGILRACYNENVLKEEEIRSIVKDIEKGQHQNKGVRGDF